jgi:hypothetical protein
MGLTQAAPRSGDMLRFLLAKNGKPKHGQVLLGDAMNSTEIERTFSTHFVISAGRPALLLRLVAGQLYIPPRQNSCRVHQFPEQGAMMRRHDGSIRQACKYKVLAELLPPSSAYLERVS